MHKTDISLKSHMKDNRMHKAARQAVTYAPDVELKRQAARHTVIPTKSPNIWRRQRTTMHAVEGTDKRMGGKVVLTDRILQQQ